MSANGMIEQIARRTRLTKGELGAQTRPPFLFQALMGNNKAVCMRMHTTTYDGLDPFVFLHYCMPPLFPSCAAWIVSRRLCRLLIRDKTPSSIKIIQILEMDEEVCDYSDAMTRYRRRAYSYCTVRSTRTLMLPFINSFPVMFAVDALRMMKDL